MIYFVKKIIKSLYFSKNQKNSLKIYNKVNFLMKILFKYLKNLLNFLKNYVKNCYY